MQKKWDQARIQEYIDNEIEEGISLEYKGMGALAKSPGKKKEIAKDVSAMANTAGGLLIYGISEYQEKSKKHLPEKIDPVNRIEFTKEWLDQVITHNIHPRIEGLIIHPVNISAGETHVVYVVEIPQSSTAHQVTADKDYRYYERSNFESVPMADYRIRDVMNRAIMPDAEVEFSARNLEAKPEQLSYQLEIVIGNQGPQVINHFKLEFLFPDFGSIYSPWIGPSSSNIRPGPVGEVSFDIRDQVAVSIRKQGQTYQIIYRSRGVLFPNDEVDIGIDIGVRYYFNPAILRDPDSSIKWRLFADNMLPKQGEISLYKLHFSPE